MMAIETTRLHSSRFKNIKILFFANLLLGLCNGFYNVIAQPYIAGFVKNYEHPEFLFGTIMTLASLIQIIASVFGAPVSDKIGRKRVYLGGLILYIVAMVFFALDSDLVIIIFAIVLLSLGTGVADTAIQALSAESIEEKKQTSGFSFVSIASFSAGLVGPIIIERLSILNVSLKVYFYGLIGGFFLLFVYQLFNLHEPLIVVDWSPSKLVQIQQAFQAVVLSIKEIITNLLIFICLPFYLLYKKVTEKQNSVVFERQLTTFRTIFSDKTVKYALLFFLFDSFVWGISISIFYGSVVLVYGFTARHIAIIQLVFGISTIIFLIPLAKLGDKLAPNEILAMSEVAGFLFLAMNIIAFFSHSKYRFYAILIGWAGLGVNVAFWVPSILNILTNLDPNNRAAYYGTVSGIKSLGWLPTSFIAGLLIDRVNFLVPFIISVTLFPLDLFFALKFPVKKRKRQEEEGRNEEE